MKNKKDEWLACYIYDNNSLDKLLTQKVWPFVQNIFEKNYATQFFFIRYGDRFGPHIRLRFKGETPLLETKTKPLLKKSFHNSRFVPYRRELRRYGWKKGINISQEQFEASSRVILSFLSETKHLNYKRSFDFALKLNISLIHTSDMTKNEAIMFFDHLSGHNFKPEFDTNLTKQQMIHFFYLSNFWQTLDRQEPFDSEYFNKWLLDMKIISNKLKIAYRENKLRYIDPENRHIQNPLWYIYESYIHMNNNRLGINNADEPYIAFIIKKILDN